MARPLCIKPLEGLSKCRSTFLGVAILSCILNILMLSGSVFMLEVYDRVIPGRSVPTLVGLCVVIAGLYAFQAFFDILRSRLLLRAGVIVDTALARSTFETTSLSPLRHASGQRDSGLRDLDLVRSFISGPGPTALFDLPWLPFYLTICFAFHPWIGVAACCGGVLMFTLTWIVEIHTKRTVRAVMPIALRRSALAESSRRNAEAVQALGMRSRLSKEWGDANEAYNASNLRGGDLTMGVAALSKVLRGALQSGVLAIGAYLVIHGEATSGIMIASSILVSKALAPVETVISQWKAFVSARDGWRRLTVLLTQNQDRELMELPSPLRDLRVEGVSVAAPGGVRMLVSDVSLTVESGQAVAILGQSGSGKSTLARCIVGAWLASRGKVRLDGAALDQWDNEALGSHIGYLPQDIELFDGTIGQNIARFNPAAKAESIVAAAEAAGIHDLVLRQPQGYDTRIGEGGMSLSGGQRQRLGLARALYENPFLVVLDEPNSNLDGEGEAALAKSILSVRDRGGVVVVVSHRTSVLGAVSHVLLIHEGQGKMFGERDEVLSKLQAGQPPVGSTPSQPTAGSTVSGRQVQPMQMRSGVQK